jgi:hypothetical protein
MRIVYVDFMGRRHVRHFKSWADMMDFLYWNYPFFSLASFAGVIK